MSVVHLNAPASAANSIRFGPDSGLSAAIKGMSNGSATWVFIGRRTSGGDAMGLTDASTAWWHTDGWSGTNNQFDDDGLVGVSGPVFNPASTDLVMIAQTQASSGTASTAHNKNITSAAAAVHTANGANGGKRAMTGTTNYLHFGFFNSQSTFTGDLVVAALWNATLTNAQVDECWANSRTSDLWNNSAGNPIFLVEGNTLSLVDIAGANTFNTIGTATLTGTDPTWTFDGKGTTASSPVIRTFNAIPFMGGGL